VIIIKSRIIKKIFIRVFLIGIIAVLITGSLSLWASVNVLQRMALNDSKSFNEQVIRQMEYVFQNIIDLTTTICLDNELDQMIFQYNKDYQNELLKRKISLILGNICSQNSYLQNIIIRTDRGDVYEALISDDNEAGLFESAWFREYKKENYSRYFSRPVTVKTGATKQQFFYYCTRYVNNSGLQGDIILTVTFDSVHYALDSAGKYFESYTVLNRDKKPFYPDDEETGKPIDLEKIVPVIEGSRFSYDFDIKGLDGYYLVSISPKSGWTLVSFVSNRTLLGSYLVIIIINICVLVLFFIIMAVVLFPMLTNIVKPINTLAGKMSDVSSGNFDIQTEVRTGDEIEDLSLSFNYMVIKLKEYVKTLLEKEKTEQKMAYSLLISQIDPHFIYNTMNTINYLARKNRTEDVVTVNNALIQILQDRLRVKKIEIFDSVGKEVEIVNKYLVIQGYRYGENVKVVWEVDENVMDCNIPKNIIQPLIENSLMHGVLAKVDEEKESLGGLIRVYIACEGDYIVIKVTDDGAGIDPGHLARINSWSDDENPEERGKHIGLKNIRERLYYLYGRKDLLKIESELGIGTVVTVYIPLE